MCLLTTCFLLIVKQILLVLKMERVERGQLEVTVFVVGKNNIFLKQLCSSEHLMFYYDYPQNGLYQLQPERSPWQNKINWGA